MSKIHSLAVVSPRAEIGHNVEIEPFCVVEADARIGNDCYLGTGTKVHGGTILGDRNRVAEHVVLGGLPQHSQVPEHPGKLIIGHGNTIREFSTLHRALQADQATTLGDENLLMVGVHIAHDCVVGNRTILTNNLALGGHVIVEDCAYLSAGVGVHQYCRIGRLAIVGGHARIRQDVPPFVTVDGGSSLVVGLNSVGMRRNGLSREDRLQLKAAYRIMYREGLMWSEVLERLEAEFPQGPAAEIYQFMKVGKRGFIGERREPNAATLKMPQSNGSESSSLRRVG